MKKLLIWGLPIVSFAALMSTIACFRNTIAFTIMTICGCLIAIIYIVIIVMKKRERKQLMRKCEQTVSRQMEEVKGNSLKQELIKKRLTREFLESNRPKQKIAKIYNDWNYSLIFSMVTLSWLLILILAITLSYCISKIPFPYWSATNAVLAVLAVATLVWKRHYLLATTAVALATIYLWGICRVGVNGIELPAYHLLINNGAGGLYFRSSTHAELNMLCSIELMTITSLCLMLYPFLKKKTIILWLAMVGFCIATVHYCDTMSPHVVEMITSWHHDISMIYYAMICDYAIMLGTSFEGAFMLLLGYLLPLLCIAYATIPLIHAWQDYKEIYNSNKNSDSYNLLLEDQRHTLRWTSIWLCLNLIIVALVVGRYIGLTSEEGVLIFFTDCDTISNTIGINIDTITLMPLVLAACSIVVSKATNYFTYEQY